MMQQETDRNVVQLNETNKLKVALNQLNYLVNFDTVETGSLAITNNGNFFIAISAGILTVKGEPYFAISPASLIGLRLKGQKAGYEFELNNKLYQIKEII